MSIRRKVEQMDSLSVLAAVGALDSANASNDVPASSLKIDSSSGVATGDEVRGCTCKASKCLKLYCVCFAANQMCGSDCACRNCQNNGLFPEQKKAAVEAILERNPAAFQPKVNNDAKHSKGCSCRKSGCLKRYCECYNAGVLCSDLCKCVACKNFHGSEDLLKSNAPATHPSINPSMRLAAQSLAERSMSPVSRRVSSVPSGNPRRESAFGHIMLQYGKRSLSRALDAPGQPSAKRVLFQRGPALKSRFGDIGSPGGIHYKTTAMPEDCPENIKDAAISALPQEVISAAERDTAKFLALFAERAAGLPPPGSVDRNWGTAAHGRNSPGSIPRSSEGATPDSWDRSQASLHSADKPHLLRSNAGGELAVSGAGVEYRDPDLYCEETDIGVDDEPGRERGGAGNSTLLVRALTLRSPGKDVSEENNDSFGTGNGDGTPSTGVKHHVVYRNATTAGGSGSPPRPPWFASAERAAMEHCAMALRRIANAPPVAGKAYLSRPKSSHRPETSATRFMHATVPDSTHS